MKVGAMKEHTAMLGRNYNASSQIIIIGVTLVSVGITCALVAIGVICAVGCVLCLLKKRQCNVKMCIYADGPPFEVSDFVLA